MSEDLVLVSGASGYLGAHVVKALQEAGYRVRGTVRSLKNEKKVDFLHKLCPGAKYPLELVEADLLQADTWPSAVADCRYVMHTASPFPLSNPKHEDEIIKPAVDGTLNVLKAASEAGTVKRVVLTSSFAAIQDREKKEGPYTEDDWSVPSNQEVVYPRSKTLAEKAAWDFVNDLPQERKLELCVINPVLIIGPALSGNPGSSVDIFYRLMERKMGPFVPQFHFPMIDVRDVAEAHVRCLTTDEAVGKRHLLFAANGFLPDAAKWLANEFNPQGYSVPTGKLANCMLSFISIFSSEIRLARDFAAVPKDISNERLKQVLGITPRSLEPSIIEMGHSLVEVGMVKRTSKYRGPTASE